MSKCSATIGSSRTIVRWILAERLMEGSSFMRHGVISRKLELSRLARLWGLGTKHVVTDVRVANRLGSSVAVWWIHGLGVSKIVLRLSVKAILNGFGFDVIEPLLDFWFS